MKAITVRPEQAGSARLDDIAEPPPEEGTVLVETLAVGVCGTDLEIVNGDYGWAPPGHQRLVLGHESLGRSATVNMASRSSMASCGSVTARCWASSVARRCTCSTGGAAVRRHHLRALPRPPAAPVRLGVGWLLHAAWDVVHFRADRVVSRWWSECASPWTSSWRWCCSLTLERRPAESGPLRRARVRSEEADPPLARRNLG